MNQKRATHVEHMLNIKNEQHIINNGIPLISLKNRICDWGWGWGLKVGGCPFPIFDDREIGQMSQEH